MGLLLSIGEVGMRAAGAGARSVARYAPDTSLQPRACVSVLGVPKLKVRPVFILAAVTRTGHTIVTTRLSGAPFWH